MKLRGTDFGYCWDQSFVRGFFGEGYAYQRWFKPFGLDFAGSTFVAKTTPLNQRTGYLATQTDGYTPAQTHPDCVRIDYIGGHVLNAVDLTSPGVHALLANGLWQKRTRPFMLSFMSVGPTKAYRLQELREFVRMLNGQLRNFKAPVALQVNFSCPSVQLEREILDLVDEVHESLEIASELRIPNIPKLSVEMPVHAAAKVAAHPECDCLCISNTIPWGHLPESIPWNWLFNSQGISPLAHMGGGGYTGPYLFPLVLDWVSRARQEAGITKPINAGGGIHRGNQIDMLTDAGASSVAIGTMAIVRPWRVQAAVDRANWLGQLGRFTLDGRTPARYAVTDEAIGWLP